MIRSTLLATGLLVPLVTSASLIVVVEDLNTFDQDVFCDQNYGAFCDTITGTPGQVVFNNVTSPILGTYWEGSAVVSLSNYATLPAEDALLGSALFALNALETGDNVAINIASTFTTPEGPPIGFFSTVNASTLNDASFDFVVNIDGNILQSETDVTSLGTFQASAVYDLAAPFTITQAFRPGANAVGADIGIDFSTQAVPEPTALALLGLGLIGMVGMRKLRKS